MTAYAQLARLEYGKAPDSVVIDYYFKLANLAQVEQDYISANYYCDTILLKFPDSDFYVKKEVQEEKAEIYQASGQTEVAVGMFLELLTDYNKRGEDALSAELNNRLGILFLRMNELTSAEYHLNESIKLAEKINDQNLIAASLMSLGNRYKKVGDFEKAEDNYLKSIAISKQENFQRLLAGNYNNYGSLFRMTNKLDRALHYYKLAVAINTETKNDRWLSYNYNNIGNIYKERGNNQEALRYFFMSNEIKRRIDDPRGMSTTLMNISSVYESMGNYKLAHKYFMEYTDLKDSLANVDNVLLTKKLAAEFQAERREAEIKQLNTERELDHQKLKARDEQLSYQNFLSWLFGIGIFLVLIIAGILWYNVVNRKKANEILQAKNDQIDRQHKEIIDSINYAKRIQNSILPSENRLTRLLGSYGIMYKPKDIISGDFYVCDQTENGLYFGTVDCTGHGVPGAMVSLVASAQFNKMIHELKLSSPGEVLNQLNKEVPKALDAGSANINDGMDMALCKFNPSEMTLEFSGAHQNCWIITTTESLENRMLTEAGYEIYQVGEVGLINLKGSRQGIGKSTHPVNFTTSKVSIVKGDKVLMSTDGYQDQFGGPNNTKFKVREMRNLVLENGALSAPDLCDFLEKKLVDWQGTQEQIDDICVMVVEL